MPVVVLMFVLIAVLVNVFVIMIVTVLVFSFHELPPQIVFLVIGPFISRSANEAIIDQACASSVCSSKSSSQEVNIDAGEGERKEIIARILKLCYAVALNCLLHFEQELRPVANNGH